MAGAAVLRAVSETRVGRTAGRESTSPSVRLEVHILEQEMHPQRRSDQLLMSTFCPTDLSELERDDMFLHLSEIRKTNVGLLEGYFL